MNTKNIKITKKDGSKEMFDPKKIERVLNAAGLNDKQTKYVTEKIIEWVKNNKEFEVSSQDIRKKVYQELQAVDEYTANFYKWYKKTEGKSTSDQDSN
jgi:transcriptional regulator NrdR family protein